ncbi:Glycopeptide antibiotics resistance protein [Ruminococcus flavefaciens]|uniref:Glycopeptide antibiotics resistance protein n=2 Tax=Ruminococcus flavefaciens TaxID=1265 RepID=A0A1H6KN34_RUMFL|nr:Glycopeptide antibiotics resistance protein [Ruminococcus flavefaciens]
MIEISYMQMFIFITLIWILVRFIIAIRSKTFSVKRELQMLLIYICIVVIARFVYFPLHHVDGGIDTLKIGFSETMSDMVSFIPFYFLFDRYDGWIINIIGNIAMFIPVGIVWPICFRKLDNIKKTLIAGISFILFIELSQLLCLERHTDVDDVILNTSGVLIGACIVFAIRKLKKQLIFQKC